MPAELTPSPRDEDILSDYLTPQVGDLWGWSESGDSVDWIDGTTIVFRQELLSVLTRLADDGLPPMDSLIWVLAATRNSFSELAQSISTDPFQQASSAMWLKQLLAELQRVHAFPELLRTTIEAKLEITATIFDRYPERLSREDSWRVINLLGSGYRCQQLQPSRSERTQTRVVIQRWRTLCDRLALLDQESLRLRLQTGLTQTIHIPVPDQELEESPRESDREPTIHDLLKELSEDREHGGLVRLVRNLAAITSLPHPLIQVEELPIGGVSDITNRGPLDKLLLSELAHDDDTLMTRIALNEALFLRRETPPATPHQKRVVLIDNGLRMWGTPRVYATATAMALAAKESNTLTTEVFRTDGDDPPAIHFTNREQLEEHLGALGADMEPSASVEKLCDAYDQDDTELVLITCQRAWADNNFRRWLHSLGPEELYAFLVERDGSFQLVQHTRRGDKVLRQAKLELDQFLEPRQDNKPAAPIYQPSLEGELPHIIKQEPFPLRVPQNVEWTNAWLDPACGVFAVTRRKQLQFWNIPSRGPVILKHRLPARSVLWAEAVDQGHVLAVVGNLQTGELFLLVIYVRELKASLIKLHGLQPGVRGVAAHGNTLFVIYKGHIVEFNKRSGKKITEWTVPIGYRWRGHGRFFNSPDGLSALAAGKTFETVPTNRRTVSAVVDGPQGLCVAYRNGTVEIADRQIKTQYPYFGQANISKLGHHILIADQLINTFDGKSRKIYPYRTKYDLEVVGGGAQSWLSDRAIHKYLQAICLTRTQIVVVTRSGQRLKIEQTAPNRFSMTRASSRPEYRMCRFEQTKSEYLRVAEILNSANQPTGVKVYLDTRGMLHLTCTDGSIPDATLVLFESQVSGWSANGHRWGEKYFHDPDAQLCDPATGWQEAIAPFLEHVQ